MLKYPVSWLTAFALIAGATVAPVATVAAQDAETVTVTLSNFEFSPATIRLRAGEAVHLVLINQSSSGHSFAADAFFTAAKMDDATRGMIRKGRIEVKKGTTVELDLVAPAPGTYKLHCSHLLHAGFGMTGEIVVD